MKAKILVQSPTVDTYINVMAALCDAYPINKIMLSFIGKEPDDSFIDAIQGKLLSLSSSSSYSKASRVQLEVETADKDHIRLVKGWDVIDVTAVSKVIAINVSAACISNKKVHICQLSWRKRFSNNEPWILEDGNHQYTDLMSAGALSSLYQDHFQKKHVIIVFGALFSIVFLLAIAKFFWPGFVVPEDFVNVFSLLIGAAGLYLAIISLKAHNA